jgi:Tfp pilus assembly protein PilW
MEMVFAVGISSLVFLVLTSIYMLSVRNFTVFANYVDLNGANRLAMDMITRDLREANRLTACTTNSISIEDAAGATVSYTHNAGTKRVIRTVNGSGAKVVLTGCDSIQFRMLKRNPVVGSYNVVPTSTATEAKVVDAAWNCSRTIFGVKANTENVQTARIVIRRQGT